jgi:hypothetical protein
MERFKNKQENTVLNDWDRKILLEGGNRVIHKIMEQEGVPDVIILPETSARPLFYLINPSFKKIAEHQNTKPPKYVFFAPSKSDLYTQNIESKAGWDEELSEDILDMESFKKYSIGELAFYEGFEEKVSELEHAKSIKSIENTFNNKFIDEKRAQELLQKIEKEFGDNPKIIIIDEFISNGNTRSNIKRAFHKEISDYAIFATSGSAGASSVGTVLPVSERNLNPSNGNDTTLSYKNPGIKNSIGVIKENGNPIVKALYKTENFTPEDQEKIRALRKEIKSLGEQLASEF